MIKHAASTILDHTRRADARSASYGISAILFVTALVVIYKMQMAEESMFQCLIGILSIILAGGISLYGWHADRYARGSFFAVLAVGYLSVLLFEIVNLLVCPQMALLRPISDHSAFQTRAVARFAESLSLLIAPFFHYRVCNQRKLLLAGAVLSLVFLAAIFAWPGAREFSMGVIEGAAYKNRIHYLTATIFGGAMVVLYIKRHALESNIWVLLVVAGGLAMGSQLAFGMLGEMQNGFSKIGYYIKFISFYMLFMAMIDAGLLRPDALADDTPGGREIVHGETPADNMPVLVRHGNQPAKGEVPLQSVLDTISEPMLILDNDLQAVHTNRATTQALPSHALAVNGALCHPLLCGGAKTCSGCAIPKLCADRRHPNSFERRSESDPDRIEKIEFFPLTAQNHGFEGTIVRIMDLTKSRQLERHLIHSEKMSTLGFLVSGIVHEISNPNSFITFNLPILRTYLQKILAEFENHLDTIDEQDWFGMDYATFRQEVFSLLENLSHGADRISKIVNNLKEVTHPQLVGQERMHADLRDVIGKAVTLCRNEVSKHATVFKVESPTEPTWLHAAPEALEQVLINLLVNAAHAADKQDSWIKLKTHIPESPDDLAVIEISDNGCGIDAQQLDRVFDPFFTTKDPGSGTGLGLSISLDLIQQMGGRIEVQSKPGQGTKFSIYLPLSQAGEAHQKIQRSKPQHVGQQFF